MTDENETGVSERFLARARALGIKHVKIGEEEVSTEPPQPAPQEVDDPFVQTASGLFIPRLVPVPGGNESSE